MIFPVPDIRPDGLLSLIARRFVAPLLEVQAVCQDIDIVHNDSFTNFRDLLHSLLTGSPPAFVGRTADELLQRFQSYEAAELAQMGAPISERLSQIARICGDAANHVSELLDTFPLAIPGIPIEPFFPVWTNDLAISRGLGASNDMYLVTFPQGEWLELMGIVRWRWANDLGGLDNENFAPSTRLPDLLVANNFVREVITLPPVTLTPTQQQQLLAMQAILNVLGIRGLAPDDLAALLARGFLPKDILTSIILYHQLGKSDSQISDLLFLAAFNQSLASYYNGGIPYGFASQSQYQDFSTTLFYGLQSALNRNGQHYCVGANVGGSAVTGVSYKRGQPFDQGRASDYDITLNDPQLIAKAEAMGVKTYDGGLRTGPLTDEELIELGLYDLERQLTAKAGRPVHFLLYASAVDDYSRAPYITFFPDTCSSAPSQGTTP